MGAACCCASDTVWKLDGWDSTMNSYSLHNLTNRSVSVAVYYRKIEVISRADVIRATDVIVLHPQERLMIAKPKLKLGYLRMGVIQGPDDPDTTLAPSITAERWRSDYDEANHGSPPHVMDLELQHALVIYEARKHDGSHSEQGPLQVHLTNPPGFTQYKLTAPLAKSWEQGKEDFLLAIRKELTSGLGPYRYGQKKAKVRYSKELPDQERDFVARRLTRIRDALGKFLEMDLYHWTVSSIDQLPKIGIACSGGGYRAMLASLGCLVEFEAAGLMDCILYTAGLSGGAWLLSNIYAGPADTMNALKGNLTAKLQHDFYTIDIFPTLAMEVRERLAQHSVMNLIDDYSWLLHHHMQRDYPTKPDLWNLPRLSEQTHKISQGERPMPIYCAVTAQDAGQYRWMEFTPYEAGLRDDVNAFVPTWAYGRNYKDGVSVDFNAEPSLGFMAGLWGSAFCATVDQIFSNLVQNEKIQRILHQLLYNDFPTLGDERLFAPAVFPNFAFQGPLSHIDSLRVMDAGCDNNIPFVPLIRPERQCDVILALDQSGGRDQYLSTNLQLAAQYAKKFNWPFPDVSDAIRLETKVKSPNGGGISAASTKHFTICDGNVKKKIPTVIYMTLLKNEKFHPTFDPRTSDFCETSNWTYKREESDLLCGLAAFNTKQCMEQIKKTLKAVLLQKIAASNKDSQKQRLSTSRGSVAPVPATPTETIPEPVSPLPTVKPDEEEKTPY